MVRLCAPILMLKCCRESSGSLPRLIATLKTPNRLFFRAPNVITRLLALVNIPLEQFLTAMC